MTAPLIGSLFTGYGGLDMAVEHVTGARPAWFCEVDPAPSRILAHHWPGVPNLGDITAVEWSAVEPVDILTGGFPCQDVSHAGRRAGLGPGTRTGLWSRMADAIDHLRPRLVVAENVRGLLSAPAASDVEPCPWCLGEAGDGEPALRALGAVLADLAELGYDAAWHGLRAADVGAPHGRFRVFVVAWPAADADGVGPVRGRGARGRRGGPADDDLNDAADADRAGREGAQPAPRRHVPDGCTPPDASGDGRHEGRPESVRLVGRPDAAIGGAAAADAGSDGVRHQPVAEPGGGGQAVAGGAGAEAAGHTARPAWREQKSDLLAPPDERAAESGESAGQTAWGPYAPAVGRWERVLGRPAPAPTEPGSKGQPRLSPAFVEWMMGLPAGHVTAVPGLSRNDQLKALGNGVVPQQAAAALRVLLGHVGRCEP